MFDDLDDDFFPEAEMLTNEELQETIEENKLSVKAYKRRKCGRKKIADNMNVFLSIMIFQKKKRYVAAGQNLQK